MPEISKKKHLLPSFCKYLRQYHMGKSKKKHPLKEIFFRGCKHFLSFSVGFAARPVYC